MLPCCEAAFLKGDVAAEALCGRHQDLLLVRKHDRISELNHLPLPRLDQAVDLPVNDLEEARGWLAVLYLKNLARR